MGLAASPSPRRIVAYLAAGLTCAMGALALAGWWLGIAGLKSVVPHSTVLRPNVALGFILCGLSLAGLSRQKGPKPTAESSLVGAVALLLIALGSLTLGEHLFGWNLGIDNLLVRKFPVTPGISHPGRMMPPTALCFILAGCTLITEVPLLPQRFRFPLAGGFGGSLVVIGVVTLGCVALEAALNSEWSLLGVTLSGVSTAVGFVVFGVGSLALLKSTHEQPTWSLDSLTTIGFLVGILLMVITAGFGFSATRRMLHTNEWVTHRQEMLKEIQESMTELAELSSSERIYVIVGEENFLKERAQTMTDLRQDLNDIRRLAANDQGQRTRVHRLESLIRRRIDFGEQVIAARRGEGFSAAARLTATGAGLKLSEQISAVFKEMQDQEYRLLEGDQQVAESASLTTFLILPLGAFVGLAVFSLAVFFLNYGVAERTRAEKALLAREAQLNTIVENLDEGIVVSDLNGNLLHWNGAALKLHGYGPSEQDRRSFPELADTFELSTLDGSPILVEQWPLARILRGETLRNFELRVHRIGTDRCWIFNYGGTLVHDQHGNALMAIVTIDDITERKTAENQLQASLREVGDLKTALDEHAIVAITNPQGKITYANDKFCAISKFSREELLGQDHRIINSEYHPREFMRNLWTTIARGEVWHGEIRNRAKDGFVYWVDTTIVPFLKENGKPRQYVAIRTDITERKRAEEEVRQLNAELEERVQRRTAELEAANKELEAFSYSVSHDLRAPLRAVDGFSQAVLEDYGTELPGEGRHYLETIREGAQRMGVLIDDLLTFSRLSRVPLNKQPVNPKGLVREALEELETLRNGRDIDLRVGELTACHGDAALLKQVWINLLSNALKYTRKRKKSAIEIGSNRDNGENVYFVSDNGTGFDMQYASKLFGVFQRLHREDEFEGTGVGLAIVRRIVHRHGGRVWANATLDHGASFYFSLPAEASAPAMSSAPETNSLNLETKS
jgi:PAS domain S-box-containing protein